MKEFNGKKIYLLIRQADGRRYYYSSIKAMLTHDRHKFSMTQRRFSQIVKERGYPFEHSGFEIVRLPLWSIPDVAADNQGD